MPARAEAENEVEKMALALEWRTVPKKTKLPPSKTRPTIFPRSTAPLHNSGQAIPLLAGATTTWSLYNTGGKDLDLLRCFHEGRIRGAIERIRGKVYAQAVIIFPKARGTVWLYCSERVKDT
ncbi:hypothetical protein TKK_0017690 [Trichogramma kaykai]|uniref:Uncharacterized protein n=1 Tax=Trichogramma kaykai TaxID=54128 RepID=A0ABD2W275_9HYME